MDVARNCPPSNMARILVTGSTDGIGLAGAKLLADQGHQVFLHARNAARAKDATSAIPSAAGVLIGDLSSIRETQSLAIEANKHGPWDCVVHNAGLGSSGQRQTADSLGSIFQVNTLAPYMLTCLMLPRPKRLLYLSSFLTGRGSGHWRE